MLNWILPIGWILTLLDTATGTATCKSAEGEIIIIDMNGV